MRQLGYVVSLLLLAVPDPADCKERGSKFSVSVGTDVAQTSSDVNEAQFSLNTGNYVLVALYQGFVGYLNTKPGVGQTLTILDGSRNARVLALVTDPRVFIVGDTFRLYGSRTAAWREKNRPGFSLEFRPQLRAQSRWRAGVGASFGRETTFTTDSSLEDVRVDTMQVTPYTAQYSLVEMELTRRLTTERFSVNRHIILLSFGPEYDVIRTRWLDLLAEGGVALWVQSESTTLVASTGLYRAFVPELTAPDADPRMLVAPGEPLTAIDNRHSGSVQWYAGARMELYPLRHVGLGANLRWYAKNRPWDRAYDGPLLGPVQVHTQAKHWTFSVSLVYAH